MQMQNNRSLFLTIITISLLLTFITSVHAESETLQVLNDTAISLYEQGKLDEAAELAQRALSLAEETMGPHNPQIAPFLNNLAVIYYAQKKYSDSAAIYERALGITEQAYGTGHPRVKSLLEGIEKCNQKITEQEEPEDGDASDEIAELPDTSPPEKPVQEETPQVAMSPEQASGVITNTYFAKKYTVQVGAFKELPRAKALQEKLDKNGYDVSVTTVQKENGETFHRVQAGEFNDRRKAELLAQEIRTLMGLDVFITTK
jgi:cell division septation protein DedD